MNFSQIVLQKTIHFIGIGGIGMSALALMLRKYNIAVQGSDLKENYLTTKLKEAGVIIYLGQAAKNMHNNISLVVKTSIIKDDNPIKFKLIVQAPNNPPVFIKPPKSEITIDLSK
jgi:UDP-N-acetylmuramate--alanine ligase